VSVWCPICCSRRAVGKASGCCVFPHCFTLSQPEELLVLTNTARPDGPKQPTTLTPTLQALRCLLVRRHSVAIRKPRVSTNELPCCARTAMYLWHTIDVQIEAKPMRDSFRAAVGLRWNLGSAALPRPHHLPHPGRFLAAPPRLEPNRKAVSSCPAKKFQSARPVACCRHTAHH